MSSLGNLNSDITVFLPLVKKPTITAKVYNIGNGKIEITSTNVPPASINLDTKTMVFMPTEQCTLWAQPAGNNVFEGWYLNGNLISTNVQYNITSVREMSTYFAKLSSSEYTITYLKSNNNL